MRQLVLLFANIGGGKTTTAKKYQERGYIVVSKDSFRYSIGAGKYIYNAKYEPIIWNLELKILNDFMEIGENIVIDAICVSKTLRKRYITLAKKYKYHIVCHILKPITMEEAIKRRMKDPHGQANKAIWKESWTKFNKITEEPTLKEGINEIITNLKEE